MKSVLVLAAAVSLASCSAKVSSGGGAPAPQPNSWGLVDTAGSQELKVVGITEGSDGVNHLVVTNPNTTAKDFSFTVDAKETGKLALSLESSAQYACTGGQLEVKKFYEDMTGGNVVSTTEAVGDLPMIAGHSYRVRYSITAAGACDGYQEDFKAVFSAGAIAPNPETPSTPTTPDEAESENACSTASAIDIFYAWGASGTWCEHVVSHPESSVSGGRAIGSGDRLAVGTKLAIFVGEMELNEASVACSRIGSGWKLPLSVRDDASPRATTQAEIGNSAEAVGKYLGGIRSYLVWSGSGVVGDSIKAWATDLYRDGLMTQTYRSATPNHVVCVK